MASSYWMLTSVFGGRRQSDVAGFLALLGRRGDT